MVFTSFYIQRLEVSNTYTPRQLNIIVGDSWKLCYRRSNSRHRILVPFSGGGLAVELDTANDPLAFFPGKLVHTNEVGSAASHD